MTEEKQITSINLYKFTYCLCVSSQLGFLVLQYLHERCLPIVLVITDSNSTEIINFCEKNNLSIFVGNPRKGRASKYIETSHLEFDILLSVNYLFIIEADLICKAKKCNVNVHGSLLPKYRGRCPNVWAIINGEKEEGITAHYITESCDEGDIIKQTSFPISDEDTGFDLLYRSYGYYPAWVYGLIQDFEFGNVHSFKQDQSKATFFGKRTPADGYIDWNWQKERIRNWTRAQAQPYYPGAFSYLNGEKIVINRISYSNLGYSWDMENGKILGFNSQSKPLVKTPNGVVVLEDYTFNKEIKINEILK